MVKKRKRKPGFANFGRAASVLRRVHLPQELEQLHVSHNAYTVLRAVGLHVGMAQVSIESTDDLGLAGYSCGDDEVVFGIVWHYRNDKRRDINDPDRPLGYVPYVLIDCRSVETVHSSEPVVAQHFGEFRNDEGRNDVRVGARAEVLEKLPGEACATGPSQDVGVEHNAH